MRHRIPYGSSEIEFFISDEVKCYEGKTELYAPLGDFAAEIVYKLNNPTGTPPLAEMVKGKKNIVILIEDNTRNTPLKEILPVLMKYLNDADVSDDRICFLTAPGTHRMMTTDEILEKIGNEMVDRFCVHQHDATDKSSMLELEPVRVGDTVIPVQVNKIALASDFLIGIGDIVPHSDAGYSGGAKIVQPGVCGFATTSATHIGAGLMEEIPLGNVDNPCRIGMEEVSKKVGLKFILNVVKNIAGEVVAVVTGDAVAAHREGAAVARKSYATPIPYLSDVVVVSSSPCDIDFWQAEKGLIAAYFAVKKGGTIVFVAPCPEGLAHNHPRFEEWLPMNFSEIADKVKSISPYDENADLVAADLALCNSRIRERANIFLVSDGLPEKYSKILGYKKFHTVQEAVDAALLEAEEPKVGILSKGGVCLPILADYL